MCDKNNSNNHTNNTNSNNDNWDDEKENEAEKNMKKNSNKALFPKCLLFFKFLHNFSVFAHCYLRKHMPLGDEFYIRECCQLKNESYNIPIYNHLNKFWSSGEEENGTLLHIYSYERFEHLAEMLRKNGFSGLPDQPNHKSSDRQENGMKKSLELRYNLFMNQYMSTLYLLQKVGFKDVNEINEVALEESWVDKHKSLQYTYDGRWEGKYNTPLYENHYADDLYNNWGDMINLGLDNDTTVSKEEADRRRNAMYGVVSSVMTMIEMKLPISQDFLVFSCIFANYCMRKGQTDKEMIKFGESFLTLLSETVEKCLTGSKNKRVKTAQAAQESKQQVNVTTEMKSEETGDDSNTIAIDDEEEYFRIRNYLWFKEYFVPSNVWFVKSYNNKNVFFDNALKIVNKGIIKQKEFIWQNIQQLKNKENKAFIQLCQVGTKGWRNSDDKNGKNGKNTSNNSDSDEKKAMEVPIAKQVEVTAPIVKQEMRQDKLEKGIVPQADESDTILMQKKMRDAVKDFDIVFENNTKIYLTQCLSYAHSNNHSLQLHIEGYFEKMGKKIACKYQAAPVKLYSRYDVTSC